MENPEGKSVTGNERRYLLALRQAGFQRSANGHKGHRLVTVNVHQ